jgi:hypothetical protein
LSGTVSPGVHARLCKDYFYRLLSTTAYGPVFSFKDGEEVREENPEHHSRNQ